MRGDESEDVPRFQGVRTRLGFAQVAVFCHDFWKETQLAFLRLENLEMRFGKVRGYPKNRL